jgi:hypothetical protein
VDAALGGRRRKKREKQKGNQLVNVCARNKQVSPHVVKSHCLFERLLQTLRLSFLFFHFSRQTAGFLLALIVCFTFNGGVQPVSSVTFVVFVFNRLL